MRSLKLLGRDKSTQIHALNPPDTTISSSTTGAATAGELNHHQNQDNHRISSLWFKKPNKANNSVSVTKPPFLPYGLPSTNIIEPPIDPHFKPIKFVESLAELYRSFESFCCSSHIDNELSIWLEQYSLLCSLGDPKLLRRCLCAARQHVGDFHSKVVLSAWLRFERRENELQGVLSMDCSGHVFECPKVALVSGYNPNSMYDHCPCKPHDPQEERRENELEGILSLDCRGHLLEYPKGAVVSGYNLNSTYDPQQVVDIDFSTGLDHACSISEENSNVWFCIGDEEICCDRYRIAALSRPFEVMLYGNFVESKRVSINFTYNEISMKGMRAVEMYSRSRRLDLFSPEIVLELLSFANRFCCEEMKSACEVQLASLVCNIEDALILIDYGLKETASLLVASCLQVLLRELPSSLYNPKVLKLFCSSEARERLALVGHGSFLLYYFLSQVSMEENMASNTTVMLLMRLKECAEKKWQKALVLHQLGCVTLERKEYKDAQYFFEAAVEMGHVYSMAGVARAKYKQGYFYSAYKLIDSLIYENKAVGWMYQERSLYNFGKKKIVDLNTATELDPTLSFPYKYRAIALVEENQIWAAISEINKIIGFKLSPDCLELRAWFFIVLEDYANALRDTRALLTLEPNYMMFCRKVSGDKLVEILSHQVQRWSQADCWLQLYDRWSSVDDIGSLAVIHQMLANDPGKSLLLFRQSLLLLRLNCQKAALHSLRLARNQSSSEHERLVYDGWILYDTGHREEALSKAEKSISIQRSFEAFFLKSYVLADTSMDSVSSSYVIQLLVEALRCPSDGLRKGQALNNLGSVYVDCGKLDLATNCYMNAMDIKHTRAHQGLARVYHLKNQRRAAYDEMTKLIMKAENSASAYEKRSEYCDRDLANNDLNMATQLDPLRTYPYRFKAAVLMDDQKEIEAVEELTKAIAFKPDLQMLHLRAAFLESMGDFTSAIQDCEAALCLDPNHKDTLDLYHRVQTKATNLDANW